MAIADKKTLYRWVEGFRGALVFFFDDGLMVTEISTNNKTPKAKKQHTFTFQYNPTFKSYDFDTKSEMREFFQGNRDVWTVEREVGNLFKRVDEGYTVQFGVNQTSTKVDDIEFFDGFYIDYDGWDKKNDCPIQGVATIEEILELPFVKEHCLFYQRSFSDRPNALSVHLFFKFDKRTRDFKDHHLAAKLSTKILTEQLGNRGGFDESVNNNVGQVCFGGKSPAVEINLNAEPINLEEFVEEAEELGILPTAAIANRQASRDGNNGTVATNSKNLAPKKSQPESSGEPEINDDELNFTQRVLRGIHDDIVQGVLGGDWSKLFYLHDHNFVKSGRALPEGAIGQLDGSNPFSATDKSGKSFTITQYEYAQTPVFYDRSGGFQALDEKGLPKSGGSYLEYVFALEKTEKGIPKYCTPNNEGKYVIDPELFKKHFKDIVKSVYKYFGVSLDLRKFKTKSKSKSDKDEEKDKFDELIKEIVADCKETFEGKIFFLEDREYFAWVSKRQVWEFLKGVDKPYAAVFGQYISAKYGESVSNHPKLRQAVMQAFKNGNETDKPIDEKSRFIPLQNGLFDINTKEFIENDGRAYNRNIYPWNYKKPTSNDEPEVIKKLREFFCDWSESDIKGKILFNWMVVNAVGQGFRTEKMLGIIGASGKGKTSYGYLLYGLINGLDDEGYPLADGYARKPNADRLTSDYSHATAVLEGKRYIFLEELTGSSGNSRSSSTKSLKILKEFAGNIQNRVLGVNPKGMTERFSKFLGAITFDCENLPKLPENEKGYFRRIIFVKIEETSPGCPSYMKKWIRYFNQHLEQIFNWCLHQDIDSYIDELVSLVDNTEMSKAVREIRLESSSHAQFIIDRFELVDDPNKVLTADEIFSYYNNCCEQSGYGNRFSNKATFGKMFKGLLTDKGLFDWKGENKQQRVDGKVANVYTNLQYKDDES